MQPHPVQTNIARDGRQPSHRSNRESSELSPALLQATPLIIETGRGSHLYDHQGKAYLDFTAGIGVTSTGHCHPRVVAAAREQVGSIIHAQYTTVLHRPLLELTDRLGEVLPAGLDSVFYANSGSEASQR